MINHTPSPMTKLNENNRVPLNQMNRVIDHVEREDEEEEDDELDQIVPIPILVRSQAQLGSQVEFELNKDDLKISGGHYVLPPTEDQPIKGVSSHTPNPPTSTYPPPKSKHSGTSHPTTTQPNPILRGIDKLGHILFRHLKFVGPGLVSSVAYFDP